MVRVAHLQNEVGTECSCSSHKFSHEKCSEIFPDFFEPFNLCFGKNPAKFPPNFPQNFPPPNQNKKKASPTSFCRRAGRANGEIEATMVQWPRGLLAACSQSSFQERWIRGNLWLHRRAKHAKVMTPHPMAWRLSVLARALWRPAWATRPQISWTGKSCFSNRALVKAIFEAPKCLQK